MQFAFLIKKIKKGYFDKGSSLHQFIKSEWMKILIGLALHNLFFLKILFKYYIKFCA